MYCHPNSIKIITFCIKFGQFNTHLKQNEMGNKEIITFVIMENEPCVQFMTVLALLHWLQNLNSESIHMLLGHVKTPEAYQISSHILCRCAWFSEHAHENRVWWETRHEGNRDAVAKWLLMTINSGQKLFAELPQFLRTMESLYFSVDQFVAAIAQMQCTTSCVRLCTLWSP